MSPARIIISAAALLCLGCGEDRPKGAEMPAELPGAGQADVPNAPATPKSEQQPAPDLEAGRISSVSGPAEANPDGGPSHRGIVKLSWADPDVVVGSLDLAGTTYEVNGYKKGETLSCWLTFLAEEPGKTQRGVLSGTVKGDRLEGTFAISATGGTSPVNGTWSAKL